jgi:hypothetical protein
MDVPTMIVISPEGSTFLRAVGRCCLLVVATMTAVRAEEEGSPLPATVKVVADHTYLRAGPGDDFYPTERLVGGQSVEIWAIDPSGYCAVRPVAGSFSWVRGSDIDDEAAVGSGAAAQPAEGDATAAAGRTIGVIVADGAVSRIGSQINDLRHVAQVRLEAGERVQVIEQVRIAEGRHAGLWVRIEPPAGEFRWAPLADLEIPPGITTVVQPAEPAADAAANVSAAEALAAMKTAGEAIAQVMAEADEAPAAAPAAAPAPQALDAAPGAKRLFAGWLPLGASVFDPATPVAPVAVSAGAVTASADEFADIDLALSLAVSGPSESWNLAPIRERLRQSAARAGTQPDRLRAEAIDARLSRFEAIQSGQRSLATTAPADPSPLQLGSMWSSLSRIGTRPIRPGVLANGAPADGQPTWTPPDQTETTGRLATVVSRRPEAPRWALVDDSNQVIVFVTPSSGVNLAPLVGQQVSVRGSRGYMPEYKRPYLVASEARMRLAAAPDTAVPDTTR